MILKEALLLIDKDFPQMKASLRSSYFIIEGNT